MFAQLIQLYATYIRDSFLKSFQKEEESTLSLKHNGTKERFHAFRPT